MSCMNDCFNEWMCIRVEFMVVKNIIPKIKAFVLNFRDIFRDIKRMKYEQHGISIGI